MLKFLFIIHGSDGTLIEEKKKRMCSFNKDWKKDHDWLVETTNPQEAGCIICQCVFKIGYRGVAALKQHVNSDSYKTKIRASASCSVIDKFLIKVNIKKENTIVGAEIAQIYIMRLSIIIHTTRWIVI